MAEATNTSMCLEAIFAERGIDPDEFVEAFADSKGSSYMPEHVRQIIEGKSRDFDLYFVAEAAHIGGFDSTEVFALLRAVDKDRKALILERKRRGELEWNPQKKREPASLGVEEHKQRKA